jgi:hypothetical protein
MPRRSQPGSGSISALVDVNAYVPPRQAMRHMSGGLARTKHDFQ